MALRAGDVYLSYSTRHALRLLAQASQGKQTSDGIADEVLIRWLQAEHGDVWAFVTEQSAREQSMVQRLTAAAPAPAKRKGAA